MKRLLVCLLLVSAVGCAKNEIKLENQGARQWQQVQIKAGGHLFEIEPFKAGAVETLRFRSQAEDGGLVRGTLNGEEYQAKFGYFTPNLTDSFEIIFDDNGSITVKEGL
tara:strand:- start:6908 stop:7234 length:327 start_codon:yes stop_codon:yes gene_type:complete